MLLSLLLPLHLSVTPYTWIHVIETASIMRFSIITAALLAPFSAQAVVSFTNNAYNDITPGAPFTLTWDGDGTVRIFARLLRTSR